MIDEFCNAYFALSLNKGEVHKFWKSKKWILQFAVQRISFVILSVVYSDTIQYGLGFLILLEDIRKSVNTLFSIAI